MAENNQGTTPVDRLRASVEGRVLVPGDADFEQACKVYLGGMDQRPDVVVQPADAADVARVVAIARDSGVPFGVKSGGHSPWALTNGGIVLHLASLRELDIDPESRTAWAGAGLTAGEFTKAAHEHGLALGFGDTPSVGLGGITVGGGVGYLYRRDGLTIDHLLAAEIVTADGQVRVVDADNDPDLFWAIRGGGGNFGVLTRMKYRLHELSTVYAGLLVLPATPETIAGYSKLSLEAPRALTSIVNMFAAPEMPFIPEDKVGTPVMLTMFVYAGEGEAAEQALAPFRNLAEPYADMIEQIPFPNIYEEEEDDWLPIAAARNLFMDDIDLADAEIMLERLAASTADMAAVQIRPLGGGVAADVAEDATAYGHRGRNFMLNLASIYSDLENADTHAAWVDDFTVTLQKGVPGVYVNFLEDDSAARIGEAYSEQTWARLRSVKQTYDPGNLFRVNNNIPPSGDN
ncbi:FAD-linked oxidase [Actinophytocola xinjiangensis]|uniref:FAD-linked oxidase n=1 Tax=Actinophytocola xinjiangensis TaxID=485602 RepID=A0A7Z0WRE5_9PSEU|nr:FAD-binding oxidoreductase [Actinophytocola xinjiangensis]OLF12945.1 FAD-linked oxidase [Actinophytocola xinjiangensis]